MTITKALLLVVSLTSLNAFAGGTFSIRLSRTTAPDLLAQTADEIRKISVETATGAVTAPSRRGFMSADLSDEGAARVRVLPGIEELRPEVEFETLSPTARDDGGIDHVITLRHDLPKSLLRGLHRKIEELAMKNGVGYFERTTDYALVANLPPHVAAEVAALDGVSKVRIDGPPGESPRCDESGLK